MGGNRVVAYVVAIEGIQSVTVDGTITVSGLAVATVDAFVLPTAVPTSSPTNTTETVMPTSSPTAVPTTATSEPTPVRHYATDVQLDAVEELAQQGDTLQTLAAVSSVATLTKNATSIDPGFAGALLTIINASGLLLDPTTEGIGAAVTAVSSVITIAKLGTDGSASAIQPEVGIQAAELLESVAVASVSAGGVQEDTAQIIVTSIEEIYLGTDAGAEAANEERLSSTVQSATTAAGDAMAVALTRVTNCRCHPVGASP